MSDTNTGASTREIPFNGFMKRLSHHAISVKQRPQLTQFLDHRALKKAVIEDCDIAYARSDGVEFYECTFRDVRITHSDFGGNCRFCDCVFERCTIDNSNFVEKTEIIECAFVNCKFKRLHLNQVSLRSVKLKDCTLEHQTMIRGSECEIEFDESSVSHLLLEQSQLRTIATDTTFQAVGGDGTISESRFDSSKILGTLPKTLGFYGCLFSRTRFGESVGADFPGCEFTHCCFDESQIQSRDLRHCQFEDCTFFDAEFQSVDLKGASLRGARGLRGRCSARSTSVDNADTVWFSHPLDIVPWWRVRWLGSMPLFGASYITLLAIMFLAEVLRWYNTRIAFLDAKFDGRLETWIERLGPVPMPHRLRLLFFSILALALGSTIYRLLCPSLVQEHSESEWKNVLAREPFEYRINSYSFPPARWISGLLYGGGALGVLWYLSVRVVDTAKYIWG